MKFLIVDDHAVVREGVAAVLRQGHADAAILQAPDGAAALAAAGEHLDIDMVFLDLMLPGVGGMAVLADFCRAHPSLPVMMLSSSEAPSDVRRALASGALGYVAKSASPTTLLAAVNLILAGEVYVPPFMAREDTVWASSVEGIEGLTARQIDVLKLIGEDIPNKEIAYRLGLSEKTVKAHATAVFRALNVTGRAQAARAAREAGLI